MKYAPGGISGKTGDILDLEHLKYHNVGIHPEDKKETLRAVIQALIKEMQKNENDVLVQLVGENFATGGVAPREQ